MYDAIIIGSGPAGSACAKIIAENGFSVKVYDRRTEIGAPVRCGEGISKSVEELIGRIPLRCIAKKIKGSRIYAPNGKFVDIPGTGYVLERKTFDKWLTQQATNAGAEIQCGTLITKLIFSSFVKVIGVFLGEKIEEQAKVLILATGAESPLTAQTGIDTTCKLNLVDTCIQYEMVGVKINENYIHIFLGNEIAHRGYAWCFPKGKSRANVGLGVIPHGVRPKELLDRFISKKKEFFDNCSIIEINGGAVPVGGILKNAVSDRCVIVGEAAHHVNPVHGGGIKEAIISGQIAGEIIVKCLRRGDLSKAALNEFNKKWWEVRGKTLKKVEKVREIVEKLSDEELNKMVEIVKPEDVIEWCRGARLPVLAKVIARFPRMLRFIPNLLH